MINDDYEDDQALRKKKNVQGPNHRPHDLSSLCCSNTPRVKAREPWGPATIEQKI